MERLSRQKIKKETKALNDTLDHIDLIDIYRAFYLKVAEYTFSSAHGRFSRIDHMLGHKAGFGKFKKVEIISSIFSNCNAMRLEIISKRKTAKNTNRQRLKTMLVKSQWVTEEIKEEIKKYLETNENENTMIQNLWEAANVVLTGTFIAIQAYLRKQEKSQIKNLTLHLKQLEKEEQTKPKVSRRKEIIKIRAEINEI